MKTTVRWIPSVMLGSVGPGVVVVVVVVRSVEEKTYLCIRTTGQLLQKYNMTFVY